MMAPLYSSMSIRSGSYPAERIPCLIVSFTPSKDPSNAMAMNPMSPFAFGRSANAFQPFTVTLTLLPDGSWYFRYSKSESNASTMVFHSPSERHHARG